MKTISTAYKFIGKVLPDGHLSIPDEVAKGTIKEFEVTMIPADGIKKQISRYLEDSIKRNGKMKDVSLNTAEIEKAIRNTFGTTDIDVIIDSVRK
jgi:hypothetical protein